MKKREYSDTRLNTMSAISTIKEQIVNTMVILIFSAISTIVMPLMLLARKPPVEAANAPIPPSSLPVVFASSSCVIFLGISLFFLIKWLRLKKDLMYLAVESSRVEAAGQ